MSVTRVRIEASGREADAVEEELIDTAAELRDKFGGQWTEDGPPMIQTTLQGHWGWYAIRRDET